jgi:formylglycine-generating enzyme required for sulfatase activity
VSWYAASAFAWWADAWLRELGLLAAGEALRLPSEAEWERAAAYPPLLAGSATRAGRREYPWGAWPDLTDSRAGSITSGIPANINASKIGGTSAVGIFPHGLAACGAEELAGNVWEWCSTPPEQYPWKGEVSAESLYTQHKKASETYLLRGGSWGNNRAIARCASRNGYDPAYAFGRLGFRLARLFSLPSSS